MTGRTANEKWAHRLRSGAHFLWLEHSSRSDGEEVTRQVKEERCREAYRVHPIEDFAVTFDHCAPVLRAQTAFDSGHDQAA